MVLRKKIYILTSTWICSRGGKINTNTTCAIQFVIFSVACFFSVSVFVYLTNLYFIPDSFIAQRQTRKGSHKSVIMVGFFPSSSVITRYGQPNLSRSKAKILNEGMRTREQERGIGIEFVTVFHLLVNKQTIQLYLSKRRFYFSIHIELSE